MFRKRHGGFKVSEGVPLRGRRGQGYRLDERSFQGQDKAQRVKQRQLQPECRRDIGCSAWRSEEG